MDPTKQPQEQSTPSQPTPPQFGEPEPAAPQPQAFSQPVETDKALVTQSAFQSPQVAPVGPQQPTVSENPGQLLGIISIILSVLGLSLIGIILGVISRKKSKAAGASTTLGTVGMVIGIVFTVIGMLFLLLVTLAAYGGIQQRAKTNSSISSAFELSAQSEAYYVKNNSYATSVSELDIKDIPESFSIVETTPSAYDELQYVQCDDQSAQVLYYDSELEKAVILPLGTASTTAVC